MIYSHNGCYVVTQNPENLLYQSVYNLLPCRLLLQYFVPKGFV